MARVYWLAVCPLLSLLALISASHPDNFVKQTKGQCYFTNGTEHVRFVARYFYNEEEYVFFDSDGENRFVAKTELGRPDADYWNSQPDILERHRAYRDTLCKYNYELYKGPVVDRKSEPNVKIVHTPTHLEYENILTCFVDNFLPATIKVTWLKNGVEESEQVTSSELLYNGDWTYDIHVNLETTIKHGDLFTCRVEHISLTSPIEVHWKLDTPASAASKKLTGIVGFVLGAVFFTVGLLVYLKNRKGIRFLPVQQNNPMS